LNYNNSNNKVLFNLNNFLYVDCKEAPNYVDFINSIEITEEYIEYIYKHGFTKFYEMMIYDKLKSMDQTKRPIHCIDKKRKKIMLKHEDKWDEKCYNEKKLYSIDKITNELMYKYVEWKNKNPNWKDDTETEIFDKSIKINTEICSFYNDKKRKKIEKEIDKMYHDLTIKKEKSVES
jgi:hypothetical protein